ncbi:MAG TPA: hypothetical protein VEW93_02410 [Acidimicrobiales bacterium]|nr:hypothetical protein [Acidimicrobiales bacterium]
MSTAIADRKTGTKAKLAGVAAAAAALASTAVVLTAPAPAGADEYDCAYQATVTSDYFYDGQNWYAETAAQLKSTYTGCYYIYAATQDSCASARLRYIGEGGVTFTSPTHAVCEAFYLNMSGSAITSGTKFRIESQASPEAFHLRY